LNHVVIAKSDSDEAIQFSPSLRIASRLARNDERKVIPR